MDAIQDSAGAIAARLDRLPTTRHLWRIVVILSLGGFFEFYELFFTGVIAPGLMKEGILTATTKGMFGGTGFASFVFALFAGLFVGTLICGRLADRFGRRSIFTWSLLWYALFSAVMAFQTNAEGLNLFRFIAAIGIGVELVTIDTYLAELMPRTLRGRAFAINQAIGFTAVPIVALLAWQLTPAHPFGFEGWRVIVLLGSISAIAIWWIRLGLPESPRWLAQKGKLAEAERIIAVFETKALAESGRDLPPPELPPPPREHGGFMELWSPAYRRRTIMLCLFNLVQTIGYYGFASWVPTLLIHEGISITHSLLYTTVIAIAAPLGPVLGLTVADRHERRNIIVVGAAVVAIAGLIMGFARTPILVILAGMAITLAGNIISFAYHAYQVELFPTRIRATAAGFVYSWSRVSAAFSGFIIAYVLARAGVGGVFGTIAGAMVLVMLIIGLMGPRTRDLALEKLSA